MELSAYADKTRLSFLSLRASSKLSQPDEFAESPSWAEEFVVFAVVEEGSLLKAGRSLWNPITSYRSCCGDHQRDITASLQLTFLFLSS